MQTILTNKQGLKGVINAIDKSLNEWEAEQRSKISLIAVSGDNKRVIYEYKGEVGKTILQANIEGINGNKYYTHKGVNYLLPKVFQGKAPILSRF